MSHDKEHVHADGATNTNSNEKELDVKTETGQPGSKEESFTVSSSGAEESEENKGETTESKTDSARDPSKEEPGSSIAISEPNPEEKNIGEAGDMEEEESDEGTHHDFEKKDYSHFSKEELVKELEFYVKHDSDMGEIEHALRETKPLFDEIITQERQEALEKFLSEGGEEGDFEYRADELTNRYEASFRTLSDRRSDYFKGLEAQKEKNLEKKNNLLERLRLFVDGDESNTSITALKKLQQEWRDIGPVPRQHNKTLWANYNALIDRFYDNRSIYFELKELDRKKNLESKLLLCEKAEKLVEWNDIKEAVEELNKLHEEFKHIGPVPIEEKDAVWLRFKTASDAIYDKRRESFKELKKELQANAEKKKALAQELEPFVTFDSDRISEWNAKTKEILAIQKRWEAIGGLPRESAKEINREFWSKFKGFFNNKSAFFKKLEGQREENLKIKQELVQRAEELKDSEDWDKTADQLKRLQAEWKEIGPVPEKNKEEIFKAFKKACDHFFNKKREQDREAEKEFYQNLEQKEKICKEIEALAEVNSTDIDHLESLVERFSQIGFVPRNSIKKIQNKLKGSIDLFVQNAAGLDEAEREELELKIEFMLVKSGPYSRNKLFRKEVSLKKQIEDIENDISTWKNNMEFFANSSTADKLKLEMEEKIEKAQNKLRELRKQLKVIKSV